MSKKRKISLIKTFFYKLWTGFGTTHKQSSLIDSVSELIKEHENNPSIQSEEMDILENFVDFGELKASEVMIPRTNMIGIPHNAKYKEVKEMILTSGHTRFPVYKDSLDSVIGFLHVKDFMRFIDKPQSFSTTKVMRQPIYSPRAMKAVALLAKMRKSGVHIAIILDEYGGTDGLVTIGDVVKEIIGDMRDEHDAQDPKSLLVKLDDKSYSIDGKADIEAVEEVLNLSLSEEDGDYETFGGFVMSFLGKIPDQGEKFFHQSGIQVEIAEADARHIKKAIVKINK
jgi:magnesium and cobalt transporter